MRGRPKKIVEPKPTDLETELAELLRSYCSIPGCISKFHLDEARHIIEFINIYYGYQLDPSKYPSNNKTEAK